MYQICNVIVQEGRCMIFLCLMVKRPLPNLHFLESYSAISLLVDSSYLKKKEFKLSEVCETMR